MQPGLTVVAASDSFEGSLSALQGRWAERLWVVSQLSRIPVATACRTLTPATAIEGVTAMLATWVISLVVL